MLNMKEDAHCCVSSTANLSIKPLIPFHEILFRLVAVAPVHEAAPEQGFKGDGNAVVGVEVGEAELRVSL